MNLYFNDLTVPNDSESIDRALQSFFKMFAEFSELTGESRVWMPGSTRKLILDAIPNCRRMPFHWQLALGTFSLKTATTPREDEQVEERYCGSQFTIACNGQDCACGQMGIGALTKPEGSRHSLTLGFNSIPFWRTLHYEVIETLANGYRKEHPALCMTESSQETDPDVESWRQCAYEVALPKSKLEPSMKSIALRDDHGKDILQSLAERLVDSPYVEEVVNSLPFNPSGRTFIEKALPDGLVHLRLVDTDVGYGLVVRTTGKTLDQTQRIAKILNRRYGM